MVICDFDLYSVYARTSWECSKFYDWPYQPSLDQCFQIPLGKYYIISIGYSNTPNFIAQY